MRKPAEVTWFKGFAAGQHIGSPCPYCTGSTDAELWSDGWNQGRRKRDGYSYRDRPLNSLLADSGDQQELPQVIQKDCTTSLSTASVGRCDDEEAG
jgi:hypothetical protein